MDNLLILSLDNTLNSLSKINHVDRTLYSENFRSNFCCSSMYQVTDILTPLLWIFKCFHYLLGKMMNCNYIGCQGFFLMTALKTPPVADLFFFLYTYDILFVLFYTNTSIDRFFLYYEPWFPPLHY